MGTVVQTLYPQPFHNCTHTLDKTAQTLLHMFLAGSGGLLIVTTRKEYRRVSPHARKIYCHKMIIFFLHILINFI